MKRINLILITAVMLAWVITNGTHRSAPEENTSVANLWTTMRQEAGAPVDRFVDAYSTAISLWT